MERRNFLRSILGVAAATALPSEVWPFRKIFLPTAPKITRIDMLDLNHWGEGYFPAMALYSMFYYDNHPLSRKLTRIEYPGRIYLASEYPPESAQEKALFRSLMS